ncbi:MAG: acyl carrier protein [Marinilabiliales bacterium]|nr:MAG: acyl carrier protein [Marinilabiliales bacterium]
MKEIIAKTNDIFRKVFDDPSLEITREMTANDVDKWDSLTHLTMIAKTEETFGIKFKLKELVKMKNVGDMLDKIQEKL